MRWKETQEEKELQGAILLGGTAKETVNTEQTTIGAEQQEEEERPLLLPHDEESSEGGFLSFFPSSPLVFP